MFRVVSSPSAETKSTKATVISKELVVVLLLIMKPLSKEKPKQPPRSSLKSRNKLTKLQRKLTLPKRTSAIRKTT